MDYRRIEFYNLLALFLMIFFRRIQSLSVTVNQEECVYEYVFHDGDKVSGNFVVVDHDIYWGSDHPGVDFTVTTTAGNVVKSIKGSTGDKFELDAPRSGMYKFCFHNPSSTPETVSFYIHVGHIPNEHDLAKDEHLDPINVKIAELREALESVTAEQKYLKARDTRHRHTNESTRKRVIVYTVGEYVFLVAASALQVIFIRRLFSKSVGYNRFLTDQEQNAQLHCVSALKDGFLSRHFGSVHPGFVTVNLGSCGIIAPILWTDKTHFFLGCFFTSSGELRSFAHPLNELKPEPKVDSSGQVCGATFKVDSEFRKENSGMLMVDSAANWSSNYLALHFVHFVFSLLLRVRGSPFWVN